MQHNSRRYLFRRALNVFNLGMSMVATVFGLFWLAWLLWTLLSHGLHSINLELFTLDTPPPGAEGGMANAMIGSLLLTAVGVGLGTPVGLMAGTWLAEYGRANRMASVIRFVNDILLSAPSIVIGVFVYGVAVGPLGHFSGWAGGLSLAIIMLPVVLRTTEDMMRLVPDQMREAAAALGAPRWKVTVFIVHRASLAGMLTGVILGIARISGETAPLLFTALNNQFRSTDMSQPIANLPVMIFQFAMSPYEGWQHLAWAGALMITTAILVLSIAARLLLRSNSFGK
ncbi:MAG TPA: phosphate ABC transporter permease PstA [Gammaproteobacteria bacterium]|jgi:phosphate transport system permease protein|nr:phosphate ABC transporter permease PstA [Gammaproteobacteria bacterium]